MRVKDAQKTEDGGCRRGEMECSNSHMVQQQKQGVVVTKGKGLLEIKATDLFNF